MPDRNHRLLFARSLSGIVLAVLATASFGQGVPVVDARKIAEDARILEHMAADAGLQEQKAAERARLDAIKASQMMVLALALAISG